jgi:hypothetical protein
MVTLFNDAVSAKLIGTGEAHNDISRPRWSKKFAEANFRLDETEMNAPERREYGTVINQSVSRRPQ